MDVILSWLGKNKEWAFSGVGVLILGGICTLVRSVWKRGTKSDDDNQEIARPTLSQNELKARCRILFIDDKPFKVIELLQKAGWTHTKRIRDITTLADADVE